MNDTETIVVVGQVYIHEATKDKNILLLTSNSSAGVIGLSTALSIQQHLTPSQSLLLIARDFPSNESVNYASPWAGAHYRPVPGSSAQALREASQARRTYDHLKRVVIDEPGAGVKFVKGVEHLEAPPAEYLDEQSVRNVYTHLDDFRHQTKEELPAGVKWGVEYKTYVINSPVYCAHLLRKFILKGGQKKSYTLTNVNEAFSLGRNVRMVVNCSGLGFDDRKSFIIRGQTCLVRNSVSATITRQNEDGSWSFCIPRPLDGGTIIGGTKQPHEWDPNPSPEIRAKLLSNASKWFPFTPENKGQFDVIRDIVGRRPAREGGMRLELEKLAGGKSLVHAYGAGGRGFEISQGVAEDTVELMLENGLLRAKAAL